MPELTTRMLPLPAAALLAVILMLAAWGLYRREARLVAAAAARRLLTLRLALVLLLGALAADPVLVWRQTIERRARLLVAVDATRSFGLADPLRPAAQVEEEARALGLSSDEALRQTRAELAGRAIQGDWRREMEQRFEVSWHALGDGLGPLVPGEPIRPAWPRTDLLRAIADEVARQPREALAGVVLFTDAGHNAASDPRDDARRLASLGVQLVIVGVGALAPPPDVELVSVEAVEKVFADDEVTAQVTLRVTGLKLEKLDIQVLADGAPLASRPVPLAADATGEIREAVAFPAGGSGRKRITVQVAPVPGEASRDNNSRDLWLEALAGPARVLLADAAPRWEHRYLRETLAREKRIELAAHLASPPPDRRLPQGFPRTRDELFAHDVIILGDLGPEAFTRAEIETLRDYVAVRGGTLVLGAGERAMPYAWADTPLGPLLPVELRWPPPPRGLGRQEARSSFSLALAPRGETSELTQLIPGRERNVELWELLSRPQWVCPTAGPKAGAELLVTTRPAIAGGVVAAWRAHEAGRVLFLGIDSTWRWRFRLGDELHRRFWGQVVRWAAAGRLAGEDEHLRLGTDAIAYEADGAIAIEAQLKRPDSGAPPPVDAILRRSTDGREARVRLEPLPGSGGRYRGAARLVELGFDAPPLARDAAATAGLEEIEITAASPALPPRSAGAPGASRSVIIERPADPEARTVTCDAALGEELARLAGGAFLPLGQHRAAARSLSDKRHSESRAHEQRPLDHAAALFLVLFGLLAAEWLLRKRAHLV